VTVNANNLQPPKVKFVQHNNNQDPMKHNLSEIFEIKDTTTPSKDTTQGLHVCMF
jgi:hypothetical protein